jgi:hypothetical protein
MGWFHSQNEADDVVVVPLLPNQETVDFKEIPTAMFVDETTLKTNAIEEGDNLYFIGLMAQYYGVKRNYPVVRRGTLALMTDEPINTPMGNRKHLSRNFKVGPATAVRPYS